MGTLDLVSVSGDAGALNEPSRRYTKQWPSPHRYYTSSQIMGYAWSESALFPEEVRNYVLRVRKILARLKIPCDLVNRPGRAYSLTFRNTD